VQRRRAQRGLGQLDGPTGRGCAASDGRFDESVELVEARRGPRDEAARGGLGSRQRATEEDQLVRPRPADGRAEQQARAPVRHQADREERLQEVGVGAGVREVAGEGEGHPDADRRAVDPRDDRHRRVHDRGHEATGAVHAGVGVGPLGGDLGEVGSRREGAARAGDDDHPHGEFRCGRAELADEGSGGRAGQGVHPRVVVDRQPEHAAVELTPQVTGVGTTTAAVHATSS
jgi:hypothetical protein